MINVRSRLLGTLAILAVSPVFAQHGGTEPAKPESKAPAAEAGAMVGKPAPAFMGKDLDGKEWKLADFKDKIVVLEWVNHQCPVCVRHTKAKTAANTMAKFKDKPVVWIGVDSTASSATKVEDVKKWAKDNSWTFPIITDWDGKIGKMFGAKTTPHVFVIDAKGVLAYNGAIDDDESGTKEAKKNYVEEAVNALLKGSTVATATTKPYGCSVKYKQ